MQPHSPPVSVFKLVLVGDSEVGKSAILNRFANGSFQPQYRPTIGVDIDQKYMAL